MRERERSLFVIGPCSKRMQTRLFFDFFPPKPHYSNNLFYPPFYTTLNECSIIRHKNNKERERETEGFFKKKSWSGEREFFFITREREKRERERDLFIERERETTNPPDTPFYQFIYYAKRKIRKKQIQKREREREGARREEGEKRRGSRGRRKKRKRKKGNLQPSEITGRSPASLSISILFFRGPFLPALPRSSSLLKSYVQRRRAQGALRGRADAVEPRKRVKERPGMRVHD